MSWFIIRIIAMSTMLIDHIGWNFIENPMVLTWIGRIAFPCYAFLLAEWFFFVFKNNKRLLKHLAMLILLAVISEPCYDLLEFGADITTKFMEEQSVMITLLLWFLWMAATELFHPSEKTDKIWRKTTIILIPTYLLIGFANYKMAANFNFVWPLLIVAFYRYLRYARNPEKTENKRCWIKRFSVLLWIFTCYLIIYFYFRSNFWGLEARTEQVTKYLPRIFWHILAALILSLTNWKLWYHTRWFKNLYTIFYPLHALIIWIIITFFK